MENASKALILAGAILISIMIVSLGVLIFNNMGNSAKEAANMDEQEIANFNSRITPYVGKNISGSQVNALIQLVISINNSAINNSNDIEKTVTITYKSTNGSNNTISVDKTSKRITYTNANTPKKVETGAGKYYEVIAKYGNNGLINNITVK